MDKVCSELLDRIYAEAKQEPIDHIQPRLDALINCALVSNCKLRSYCLKRLENQGSLGGDKSSPQLH